MSLTKIAASEVNGLLLKSAHELRRVSAENAALREQLAGRQREDHAEKIASIAVGRGIMSEDQAAGYARTLASSERDLNMVEDFVARGNGVGLALGEDVEKTASDNTLDVSGGSEADRRFVGFLMSSDLGHDE